MIGSFSFCFVSPDTFFTEKHRLEGRELKVLIDNTFDLLLLEPNPNNLVRELHCVNASGLVGVAENCEAAIAALSLSQITVSIRVSVRPSDSLSLSQARSHSNKRVALKMIESRAPPSVLLLKSTPLYSVQLDVCVSSTTAELAHVKTRQLRCSNVLSVQLMCL